MFRARLVLAVFVLLTLASLIPVTAQSENLLEQAGFDDTYSNRGRPDLNLPRRWGLWLADTPGDTSWHNHVFAFPHITPPEVRTGAASLNLSGGYIAFTAAVYQQVPVERGTPLRASVWAWLHTCNFPRDTAGNITSGICDSSPRTNARVRVGIDPNGGADPLDGDIIWSDDARPHDRWERLSVDATATGPVMTVFLYATQDSPTDLNNVYWDDAALVRVSPAGVTPAAAPVQPTPAQPASIGAVSPLPFTGSAAEYVVQPGDTFDLIALRAGLSRAQLLALNPATDPRQLRVGDRLRIRPPGP